MCAQARRTASTSSASLASRRCMTSVGGRDELVAGLGQRLRAGEVEVVLLDADPLGAVERREQLGQAVGDAGAVERLVQGGRRGGDALAVERRRDQRALAAALDGDAEEALELQAPEARQIGDRGVFGGEDGVETRLLEQPVEGGDTGIKRHEPPTLAADLHRPRRRRVLEAQLEGELLALERLLDLRELDRDGAGRAWRSRRAARDLLARDGGGDRDLARARDGRP